MNTRGPTSNQIQKQGQALQPISQHELAVQTAMELISTQKSLGLSLTIFDRNLNKIEGKFENMAELLHNPDFIAKLSQELYVSYNDTTWFKLKLRNGRLAAIAFLLTLHINWMKIINKTFYSYDFIVVGYTPGDGNAEDVTTAIPRSDVTPEKIVKYFPQIAGQTANNTKEIGKLIVHMLSPILINPAPNILEYYGFRQGFAKNLKGQFQFNPAKMLPDEILPYMPVSLLSRQYPICIERRDGEDMSPILSPMFAGQKELQVMLLNRLGSWHSSFFARKDVYADNILIVKPTAEVPVSLSVAMLKNTRYDSLDAAPIGPNIKPLKFDIENVNDGMVVAIDVFAADQVKKAEKGYDLLISDATGATDNCNDVHHSMALVSGYADMYIPKEVCCVLEFGDVSVEYTAEAYKVALKRLDANLIKRTERSCNNGDFIKVFNSYIDEIRSNIPDKIPHSKHNTYIMLMTALRIYNEWYSPLFSPDIEQYIGDWLCSQEQEVQPLYDVICSDFGLHFNKKLADGYFRFTLKDEVTQVDIRVKSGQKTSMENGVFYGNGNILGYDRVGKDMVINPEHAQVVRKIYNWYLDGMGIRQIQFELEKAGIPTAMGKMRWYESNISKILKNPFYAGILEYHKQFTPDFLEQKKINNFGELKRIRVDGRHKPIITPDEFNRVQAIMEEKRKINPANKTERKEKGKRPASDVWCKLLVCDCGCTFNRKVWHTTSSGIQYGYMCYSQIRNGTIKTRLNKGLPTDGFCTSQMIAGWKLQFMAKHLFREFLKDTDRILNIAEEMLRKHTIISHVLKG